MSNKAFINDRDFVEIIFDKEIKYEKLVNFFIYITSLSNTLDAELKDILIIVDMSKTIRMEEKAKELFATAFSISIFDKLAAFGASNQIESDMLDISVKSKRAKKVKTFETRKQAEEWLQAKN